MPYPSNLDKTYYKAFDALSTLKETLESTLNERSVSLTDLSGLDKFEEAQAFEEALLPPSNSPYPIKVLKATLNIARILLDIIKNNGATPSTAVLASLTTSLGYLEKRDIGGDWWAPKVRDPNTYIAGQAFLAFLLATQKDDAVRNLLPATGFLSGGWDMRGQVFDKLPVFLKERINNYETLTRYQEQLATYVTNKPVQTPLPAELQSADPLMTRLPEPPATEATGTQQLEEQKTFYTVLGETLRNHAPSIESDTDALRIYTDNTARANPFPQNSAQKTYDEILKQTKNVLIAEQGKLAQQQQTIVRFILEAEQKASELQQQIDSRNPDSWTNLLKNAQDAREAAYAQIGAEPEVFEVQLEQDEKLSSLREKDKTRREDIDKSINTLERLIAIISPVDITPGYVFPTYTISEDAKKSIPADDLTDKQYVDVCLEGVSPHQDKIIMALYIIECIQNIRREIKTPGASAKILLPELPPSTWEISPQFQSQSVAFKRLYLTASNARPSKERLLSVLKTQIDAYQQELALELTDPNPEPLPQWINPESLRALQIAYHTETTRPTNQTHQLEQLSAFTRDIQTLNYEQAYLANLALERDYELTQINNDIEKINKLIAQSKRGNACKALQALDANKDTQAIQDKLDTASANNATLQRELTEKVATIQARLSAISFTAQLPDAALTKQKSLQTRYVELTPQLTEIEKKATAADEQLALAARAKIDVMQKLEMAKLSTLNRAYEELIAVLPTHLNRPKRLEVLRTELKALTAFDSFLETFQHKSSHLYKAIKEQKRELAQTQAALEKEIKTATTKASKASQTYASQRSALNKTFFHGTLPGVTDINHSTKLVKDEGVFNRYLKTRHAAYYMKDLFTSLFYFMLGHYFMTDQMRRTEYLHQLDRATKAYEKDPSTIEALRKLIQDGRKQPDAPTSILMQSTYFKPRVAEGAGIKYSSSLQLALSSFSRELDRTEKLKPIIDPDFSPTKG